MENMEVLMLRRSEEAMEAGSRELDRMSMKLLPWPRHVVLIMGLPPNTWALLPENWQAATQLSVWPLLGVPEWTGPPVGVSHGCGLQMIRMLERGYRGG